MDVYVVRVYRNPKAHGRQMFGCVEIIDENRDIIRQFSTTDELMDILTGGSRLHGETGSEPTLTGIADEAPDVVDKGIEGIRHHHHKLSERRT